MNVNRQKYDDCRSNIMLPWRVDAVILILTSSSVNNVVNVRFLG